MDESGQGVKLGEPREPPAAWPEVAATPVASVSRHLKLSVLTPVFNERFLVEASIRRILDLRHPILTDMQLIIVDDGSTDGTWEVLQKVVRGNPRVTLLRHETNRGKGAAIRTAVAHAQGDVCLVHDADLEYNPEDIPSLLEPFVEEGADAVFGSRYMAAPYRRALMHRHTLLNRFLTAVSNWFTDLHLTDVETCYKAVRTPLLKSIPLRSNDFRIEVELTSKLAKRRARVFEVPIRYVPRSYEEGKKIRGKDALLAILAMIRFAAVDDIYQSDEYGSQILSVLEGAPRFNRWLGSILRPHVGHRVLEIGAGLGTLTGQFIPRDHYLASDINPNYLHYLRSFSLGKPYLEVARINAEEARDFSGRENRFDTVVMVNVLEHVDEERTLQNVASTLVDGGRLVVLVPQCPRLYGTLDEALEHRLRYTPKKLERALEQAGLSVNCMFEFNKFSVPGWWVNGKVLRRRVFSRLQLKLVDLLVPFVRVFDRWLPWRGLSLVAVAEKKRNESCRSS